MILSGSALVGLATGVTAGLLGVPHRYATYPPQQGFSYLVLIPTVGAGLIVAAVLGAIRLHDGAVLHDAVAARTRIRLIGSVGSVVLIVGTAALVLH